MNFDKVRTTCHPLRIAAGAALVTAGIVSGNPWFFLGIAPIIAGIKNFCPLCSITKKCSIN